MIKDRFKILTLGYGEQLIDQIWSKVELKTDFDVIHIPHPSIKHQEFKNYSEDSFFLLFNERPLLNQEVDINYLCELEKNTEFTINNIILADEHLKCLPYEMAIKYLSKAAERLNIILKENNPNVVISGFEGFHSSLSMMVCKKIGIPWYAIVYSAIPRGYVGFSSGPNSSFTKSFSSLPKKNRKKIAEALCSKFYDESENIDKISSKQNFFPKYTALSTHYNNFLFLLKRKMRRDFDPFTHRRLRASIVDYLRRLKNRIQINKLDVCSKPPKNPYAFFGFHMQPEIGIDVWAPFFTDQINTIMTISRSLPPSHMLVVKIHRIDADNWSNSELQKIKKLPNVKLASASANTNSFIKNASLIFSIQGTIALEACLYGKNVISFGNTMYEDFSSLTTVSNLNNLPQLVQKSLQTAKTPRSEVLLGIEKLLLRFGPGLSNDWSVVKKDNEISNFCYHLEKIKEALMNGSMKFKNEQ